MATSLNLLRKAEVAASVHQVRKMMYPPLSRMASVPTTRGSLLVWAAEAVCERPGSPAGLQCALCPRGVVRLRPGAERGGYWSTLRKRPFKRGGRAAHVSTSTAAPACGGEVGGCSGGVQRLGNLGGRAGARAGRDCSDIELGKDASALRGFTPPCEGP